MGEFCPGGILSWGGGGGGGGGGDCPGGYCPDTIFINVTTKMYYM